MFLNLSVWVIGAEVLHARGETIASLADLAKLLTITLGDLGAPIFYVGVFAAVYSSVIGMAMGFGYLVTDAVRVHRTAESLPAEPFDAGARPAYRFVVVWCLFSPLVWSLPGAPDFIFLTLVGSAASVVVLPILCGALWILTARGAFIGTEWRNRWWENGFLAALFVLVDLGRVAIRRLDHRRGWDGGNPGRQVVVMRAALALSRVQDCRGTRGVRAAPVLRAAARSPSAPPTRSITQAGDSMATRRTEQQRSRLTRHGRRRTWCGSTNRRSADGAIVDALIRYRRLSPLARQHGTRPCLPAE